MRFVCRTCTWTLGLALLIPAAHADTITFPFTGTGSQFSVSYNFDITGTDFLYSIGTAEGPFVVAVCSDPGTPCTFQQNYLAGVIPLSEHFGVTAILDGLESHAATGTLSVGGTVTTPQTGSFTATVPISFTGNINARGAREAGFPPLFSVLLSGTGSADLRGLVVSPNTVVINGATYEFSGMGTATVPSGPEAPIPEPASMYLTAGGVGLIGLLLRRRPVSVGTPVALQR